jgi:hypothetical protein
MLDVGAASGDMADCVRASYPGGRVVSLDRIASHLNTASAQRVAADAFHLPFRRKSFDFVFCSLFLHHFTDQEIVGLLRGFGDVARRAVLVIDLERNPIAYYFLPWTKWLFGRFSLARVGRIGPPRASKPKSAGLSARISDRDDCDSCGFFLGYNFSVEDNEQRRQH